MPLKAACIELRPNLCSGHVFLQFEQQLGDSNKTRIVIKEHDIEIVEDNNNLNNCEEKQMSIRLGCFGLDLKQISVFVASGQHISFRFNYTQIDLEALEKAGNLQAEPKAKPLMLNFVENLDELSLHCSKCCYQLVPCCSYKRLREFPEGLIDPSEFFCHNHGSSCKTITLVPAQTDLYYGLNHIVLNQSKLAGSVINVANHLYCKRCMQQLGLLILENAAAKLWADALRWLPATVAETPPPRQLFQHSTVTHLMLRLLGNLCTQFSRALLVTTLSNRRQRYMLIQVLDSQLAVLRRLPQLQHSSDAENLHYFRACKLFYRVFDHSLDELQQQLELPRLAVSPWLFLQLQRRLKSNSQLIPSAWRFNSPEEKLQLSYFFYENEEMEQLEQLEQLKQLQQLQQQPQQPTETAVKQQQKRDQKEQLHQKTAQKQQQQSNAVEYETDAGLDASLDELEDENDSDDEHSDTDSDSKSCSLRHKSASIMQYEQNLVKRWLKQQQKQPDAHY